MNKHQAKGRLKEVVGKTKEVAGKAVGNDRLRVKGAGEQVAGKVQSGYGDAKNELGKRK